MSKAILIPAEGPPEPIEINDFRDLQDAVGGFIEAINLGRDDATCYGHDEAKYVNREVTREDGTTAWVEGLPENVLGTELVYGDKDTARARQAASMQALEDAGLFVVDATTDDPREPFIAGPIVVIGFDPSTGEDTDIPGDLEEQLLNQRQEA